MADLAGVPADYEARIRGAWQGRISGCQLGKAVELLSMREGRRALVDYLQAADALPVRDYIPLVPGTSVARHFPGCCRGQFDRCEPDDDINYSVLALLMLEEHGAALTTEAVARAWLQYLPGGIVFTAERDALVTLLTKSNYGFGHGAAPGFDLSECSDNPHNDWIGAQIRADVYGWVCPGRPAAAVALAEADASLSHRDEGVFGAMAVAAMGAVLAGGGSISDAVLGALDHLPECACRRAIERGRAAAEAGDGPEPIHDRYDHLSPVHTVNNLALVTWGLVAGGTDFSAAIGDTVAAGWDTDCNAATVGGLWGLTGQAVPPAWTEPWHGRVAVSLAGVGELALDDLVARTVAVARALAP